MIQVLHITPHLGGGVGKALSGLAVQAARSQAGVAHKFICLEPLEKSQFVDIIRGIDSPLFSVEVCPSDDQLHKEITEADIVQIEFWNHPAIPKLLCQANLPAHRLLFWCHISGLHYPRIPTGLLSAANRFIFTSDCSFLTHEVSQLAEEHRQCLGVVSSGGLGELPPCPDRSGIDPKLGYMGTLNFSKLHPDFITFLEAVGLPNLNVKLIGDVSNQDILEKQCQTRGLQNLITFSGYSRNVIDDLAKLDIFVYLLNPQHYGTAENALIEAMAMGVVPIVLDNPAESRIVEHGRTGFVVKNYVEFADALNWLVTHPSHLREISRNSAHTARTRYTFERMESDLNNNYNILMKEEKRTRTFTSIFGETPADWFKSFQCDNNPFINNGIVDLTNGYNSGLFEHTKGSVFHFQRYFPDDIMLNLWSKHIEHFCQ